MACYPRSAIGKRPKKTGERLFNEAVKEYMDAVKDKSDLISLLDATFSLRQKLKASSRTRRLLRNVKLIRQIFKKAHMTAVEEIWGTQPGNDAAAHNSGAAPSASSDATLERASVTTVVAPCNIVGTPLDRLHLYGPDHMRGKIDVIRLDARDFPGVDNAGRPMTYVLMCDHGMVCTAIQTGPGAGLQDPRPGPVSPGPCLHFHANVAQAWLPGAETLLRDADFDFLKLPNLWIDSPGTQRCVPVDGQISGSFQVWFENSATRHSFGQAIHPREMAKFDMGRRITVGIATNYRGKANILQSDRDPAMKFVRPQLLGIDNPHALGVVLSSPSPDADKTHQPKTMASLDFILVHFEGLRGRSPPVCTQYCVQSITA